MIVKLCMKLWQGGPASRKIADQLFDCRTSIGANAEEAESGRTKWRGNSTKQNNYWRC